MIKNTDYSGEKGFLFYLGDIEYRLKNDDFFIDRYIDKQPYKLRPFKLDFLAVKKGFQIAILNKTITIVIATYIEEVSTDIISKFSSLSFDYTYNNFNTNEIPGFFGALVVYPIIVSHKIEDNILKWMKKHKGKRHIFSFEFPVLVSLDNKEIFYRKKSPIWGALFYSEFRNFVEEYLNFKYFYI